MKLADEGLGMTLLPYLHAMNLNENNQSKIVSFTDPKPAREVSLIFPKSALKIHIIDAIRNTISGVVKGAVAFQNVQIVSPIYKK
jgi:LysR family hydrogen peroxide-inducible transcriptional activator